MVIIANYNLLFRPFRLLHTCGVCERGLSCIRFAVAEQYKQCSIRHVLLKYRKKQQQLLFERTRF